MGSNVPVGTGAPPPSAGRRVEMYLRRHPIVVLALLTPGIPEYLLGSSSLSLLVTVPPLFFVFLAINLGIYTGGALLVREALVRWHKGWPSLLALGAAFALVEEGLGAATFFNTQTSAVGPLAWYGHLGGVNWVNLVGLTIYHTAVSIGIPLAVFDVALPERRGRSLLVGRRLAYTMAAVVSATAVLDLVVVRGALHFATPLPLVAATLAAIAGLAYAAYRLPYRRWAATVRPSGPARAIFWVGLAYVPTTISAEYVPLVLRAPALLTVGLQLLVGGVLLWAVLRRIGTIENDRHRLALAAGVCAGVAAFGVVLTLPVPTPIIAAAVAAVGLNALWRRTGRADAPDGPTVPEGALRSNTT